MVFCSWRQARLGRPWGHGQETRRGNAQGKGRHALPAPGEATPTSVIDLLPALSPQSLSLLDLVAVQEDLARGQERIDPGTL